MKKRTLPILLLLAGLSAAALAGCGHEHTYSWKQTEDGTKHYQECECGTKTDEEDHVDADSNGKCDVCDADVHKHEYEWKSDAEKHWQECECEDKISEGAHADANADDKCDTCGRAYFAVTFAMHNHGTAPDAQKVISGGVATAPATPADDDAFKFKGWFKDESCTQAFDFTTDKIEAATTIHAKWEEDTTVGASKKYPHALTKGEEVLKAVKKDATIYFKYTAEADGRYTVSLGAGVNSQNCTFTTTLTGDTVYGKDQSAEEAHFSLKADESVTVALTFLGEDGEDVTAGIMIDNTVSEPFPADHPNFLTGEYAGGYYTLDIDRTANKVIYDGEEYSFTYVGGEVNTISFTVGNFKFSLQYVEDDDYKFAVYMGDTVAAEEEMKYAAYPTPVAMSAIFGYYEAKTAGETHNGITKIYIYNTDSTTSTTVICQQNGFYNTQKATYNTTKNRLSFGYGNNVSITYAEDGSTVSGISIGGKEYVKKGEAGEVPPEKLPVDTYSEYSGTTYAIRDNDYSQYMGVTGYNTINVIGVADGKYKVAVTVSGQETVYQMAISTDKKTITMYDAEGTQLDTLTKFEYIYHDLPTEEQEVSIAVADFQKSDFHDEYVYFFKVKEQDWYQFSGIDDSVSIYYNLNAGNPFLAYEENPTVGGNPVRLISDSEVVVGIFMDEPTAVTFTVAPTEPAVGWDESNPKVITDGSATINTIMAQFDYHFELTAPAAGSYLIHVFYDDGTGWDDSAIEYTVNGVLYSFTYDDEYFYTPITATAAGDKCSIVVTTKEFLGSKASITVAVVEDYSVGATEIEMAGTPANDSLTVSATVATGSNYYIASTHLAPVTVTGSAAFTITLQSGLSIDAEENEGVFTAEIPADDDVYFKLASETEQNVTFTQTFEKGSAGYPVEMSTEEGENTITLQNGEGIYIALSAGKYIIAAPNDATLLIGGKDVYVNTVIEIVAGEDVLFDYRYGWGESATYTVIAVEELFTEEQAGTYKSEDGITLNLATNNSGSYAPNSYSQPYNVVIRAGKRGMYTFIYEEYDWGIGSNVSYSVTFMFVEGGIQLMDEALPDSEETPFDLAKQAAPEPVEGTAYTWTDTVMDCTFTLTISDDFTAGVYAAAYSDATYTYSVTITATADGYVGTYDESGTECTLTISVDAVSETITVSDDNMFYNYTDKTFTKQA